MFRTPGCRLPHAGQVWIALGLIVRRAVGELAAGAAAPAAPAAAGSGRSDDARVRRRRRDGAQLHQADKTADFEMVMAKLKEALAEERQAGAQAAGGELEGLQGGRTRRRRQRALRVHRRSVGQGRRLQRVEHPGRGVPAPSRSTRSTRSTPSAYAHGTEHRQPERSMSGLSVEVARSEPAQNFRFSPA